MSIASRGWTLPAKVPSSGHSVSWFALEPLLQRHQKLGVVHFDAHHDLYPVPSGKLGHMNPFEFVCREPALDYLLQIGLRTDEALVGKLRRA